MENLGLKKILLSLHCLLLSFCLNAERSPFDMNNQASPIGSLLMFSGSGRTSALPSPTNTAFQYSQTDYTTYTGSTLSISAPSITSGSVSSFSISPTLPNGLALDTATGSINGVPTGSTSNQTYTITGKGQINDATSTLSIKIGSTSAAGLVGQSSFNFSGGGSGNSSINGLYDISLDSNSNLYIADSNNNRALIFLSGSSSASTVFGQFGSYASIAINNGGISADSLFSPRGITVDNSGNLFIADTSNNRILYYLPGSTTATRVYGQLGNFTTGTINNGGISANSLAGPYKPTVDADGNLYIANLFAHRVLYYPAGSTTATRVYGQLGSFTTNTLNNGGISADSLNAPVGTALDANGNLYIADRQNNRVLVYPPGSTTATKVFGQFGSFTTNTANNGGVSANSLSAPTGITIDTNGNVYIADSANHRVLYYPTGTTTATRVFGQMNSFTSNTANNGGITASSLNTPYSVAVDSKNNKLYVADNGNNRVVIFYVP